MIGLQILPSFWMVYLLCIAVGLLTTVTSNSAACTILMPIMASMVRLGYGVINKWMLISDH